MKLEQVLAEVNYEVLQGSLDKEVADIAYDSRKVKKDVMFVAIEGTVVDGHKFIDSAVAQGAGVVVVEKRVEVADKDVTVVLVKNGREALSLMSCSVFRLSGEENDHGRNYRNQRKIDDGNDGS